MEAKSWSRASLLVILCAFPAFAGEAQDGQATAVPETIVLEKGLASENGSALLKQLDKFWMYYQINDWPSLYRMYTEDFQNAMSLSEFKERKRGIILDYQVVYIKFWGDQCAQVKTTLNMTTEVMPLKKFPLRQYWVFADGTWKLFEDPHKSRLAPLRKRKPVEQPCTLPQSDSEEPSDERP